MDEEETAEIVIRGVTTAGRQFRPSDWAERLAGVFSIMGADQRVHYSRYVRPVLRSGLRCVVIQRELQRQDAMIYDFLMGFARSNQLDIADGRQTARD